MKRTHARPRKTSEGGVALLIAIFTLLLISAVAISMMVASGRETELNGNYRASTSAYYASVSGLEEARGRLLPSNVNYFNTSVAGFIPATTMTVGQVRYIVNPVGGENVLTKYPDNEYAMDLAPPQQTLRPFLPCLAPTLQASQVHSSSGFVSIRLRKLRWASMLIKTISLTLRLLCFTTPPTCRSRA